LHFNRALLDFASKTAPNSFRRGEPFFDAKLIKIEKTPDFHWFWDSFLAPLHPKWLSTCREETIKSARKRMRFAMVPSTVHTSPARGWTTWPGGPWAQYIR
jgi:hypothetical protein